MILEEVRAKDVASLNEDEKAFLAEHKSELTAEEQTKFGMEVEKTQEEKDAEAAKLEKEAAEKKAEEDKAAAEAKLAKDAAAEANLTPEAIAASAKKNGMIVMAAEEVQELRDMKVEHQRTKATSIVEAHVARGAVKADQLDTLVTQLVDASAKERATLESILGNLPSNEALKASVGSDAKTEASAEEAIMKKAQAAVKASIKEGQPITLKDAMNTVMTENASLAEQYKKDSEV